MQRFLFLMLLMLFISDSLLAQRPERGASSASASSSTVSGTIGKVACFNAITSVGDCEAGTGIIIAAGTIAVDFATIPSKSHNAGEPTMAGQLKGSIGLDTSTTPKRVYVSVADDGADTTEKVRIVSFGESWAGTTRAANTFAAGPASGADATPQYRLIVSADLPNPGASDKGGVKAVTCPAGEHINEIQTDGDATCSADTGSGSDPWDANPTTIIDEFFTSITTANEIGILGGAGVSWAAGCTTPVSAFSAGTAPNQGNYQLGCSGTTDGHGRSYSTAASTVFTDATNTAGWGFEIIFKLDSATDNRFRIGATNQNSSITPTNFIGVRADSNASWDNASTPNFKLTSCDGSTLAACTDLDLGEAVDTNWHRLRIWSSAAGTIRVLWDGDAERTICASASCTLDATGNFPASTIDPYFSAMIGQEGATAKTMTLDRLALRIFGTRWE